MKITGTLPIRGEDDWGSGAWGASRGGREHRGIDYLCAPDTEILAPIDGRISKLGWPYQGDEHYRYVQITDQLGRDMRIMYVEPRVMMGQQVRAGVTRLGVAQDISAKYHRDDRKPMGNHIHVEIRQRDADGEWEYFNPTNLYV